MTDHSAPVCECGYTKDAHAYPRAAWTAGYVCTKYRPVAPVQTPPAPVATELSDKDRVDYLEEMLPRMPAAVLIEYGEKGRITVFTGWGEQKLTRRGSGKSLRAALDQAIDGKRQHGAVHNKRKSNND